MIINYELNELDILDGIAFDKLGRMNYNSLYHENHKQKFTEEEKAYMCRFYDIDGARSVGYALGKTEGTIRSKVSYFKRLRKYDYYYKLWGK